ncbi:MAG TPA: septum formation initiator family protein [Ignavibacteriaceae bacterium]
MTSSNKNKISRYAFILLLLIGLGFLIFNNSGYIKYLKLKSEVKEIRNEENQKELENENLQAEIDSLEKKNSIKVEQIAREKYGMMKKGEKIIKVEEK